MSTNIFVFLLSYFPGSPRLFQLFDVNPLPYYVITQMTPICPRMIALPPRRLPPPFPSGDYAGRKRPLVAWEVSSAARRWGTTGNSEFGVRSSELREDGIARERNCAKTESRENGIALKRRSHRRGRRPRRPPIGLRPLKVNCCAAAREGPLGDPPEGEAAAHLPLCGHLFTPWAPRTCRGCAGAGRACRRPDRTCRRTPGTAVSGRARSSPA